MRTAFVLLLALAPSLALAQGPDVVQRKQTLDWVLGLEASEGGFYLAPPGPNADGKTPASLRATSAAVRAIKYLGGSFPHADKHAAFVLSCFDPKSGGFAEPSGKPDVALTSVGVMAAMELNIPKEKFAKAMLYLRANAGTFEEVRIAAAAVEAWGVKECPFDLWEWTEVAWNYLADTLEKNSIPKRPLEQSPTVLLNGGSRDIGSVVAYLLRLGEKVDGGQWKTQLLLGQRNDGGWCKSGEKASDIESTYRVMRALMLLKEKPKDIPALRKFIASHRNPDGGYSAKPGDKSSASGVYYATIITKWLDDMEKR